LFSYNHKDSIIFSLFQAKQNNPFLARDVICTLFIPIR
jgi:hypothetical protein